MKQGKTEVVIILDRSGSMSSIKTDIEGGFKTFLAEQKKLPGECYVTLTRFDTEYETVFENKPLAEVNDIVIEPRGGTALLDAIGRTVDTVGKRLAATKEEERPSQVVVVILSDGEENSSRKFTAESIRLKIEEQTNTYSWKFIFMGTNFDAVTTGSSYGFAASASLSFSSTHDGITASFNALNNAATFYRSAVPSASSFYAFTEEERSAANDESK